MPQLDLFGSAVPPESISQKPNTERIRLTLGAALNELRAAEIMPWDAARLRSWAHVFNNMTKWLSDEERNRCLNDFHAEVGRLRGELPIYGKSAA